MKPTAVRERLVRPRAAVGQDGVGEVVVLVDEHVQRDAVMADLLEQLVQPPVDGLGGQDAIDRRRRE